MIDYFQMMTRYNQWANKRIYRTCRFLSDDDYLQSRAMYFGSIHSCLNHILLLDQLWKTRAQGREFKPSSLDQVLYPDLESLTAAREVADERLIEWVDSLDTQQLGTTVTYHSVTRENQVGHRKIREILAHLFNHQTHHRGQVHDQLSGTYAKPPELDVIHFFIDTEQGRPG